MAYHHKQKSKAYRKIASDFHELEQFMNTVEDVSSTETVTKVADNRSVTSEQQGDVAAFQESNEVTQSDLSPMPLKAESVIMSNSNNDTITVSAADFAAFQQFNNMREQHAQKAAKDQERKEFMQDMAQIVMAAMDARDNRQPQQQGQQQQPQQQLVQVAAAPARQDVLTSSEFLAAMKAIPAPVVNVPSYGGGFSHRDDSFFSQVRDMDAAELIGTAIGTALVGGAAVVGGMWIYDKFIKS